MSACVSVMFVLRAGVFKLTVPAKNTCILS